LEQFPALDASRRIQDGGKNMTATTVSASSVIENIYKNFYDLLVAISGFSSIVYPTFPDKNLDSTSDYPIVIINSPDISWNTLTFGKNVLEGTITIDIYHKTPKDADLFTSDVSNQIETSKRTLAEAGIRQVNLESTNFNMIPHGEIKVFNKTLIFNYKFYFSKTRAW
jgi:hypothetical protein